LQASTLDQATQSECTSDDKCIAYGLGWRLRDAESPLSVVYHQGFWYGFNPSYTRYPDSERTIILLHNNTVNYRLSRVLSDIEAAMVLDTVS